MTRYLVTLVAPAYWQTPVEAEDEESAAAEALASIGGWGLDDVKVEDVEDLDAEEEEN